MLRSILSHYSMVITFVFTITFCIVPPTLAQAQLELQIDKTEVQVGEPFELNIVLNSTGNQVSFPGDIEIPGSEELTQVGQSISNQIRVINGTTQSATILVKTYIADEAGSYTIGPVELDDLNTETVTIEAVGVKTNFGQVTPDPTQPLQRGRGSERQFITLPPAQDDIDTEKEDEEREQELPFDTNELITSSLDVARNVLWAILLFLVFNVLRNVLKNRDVRVGPGKAMTQRNDQRTPHAFAQRRLAEKEGKEFYDGVRNELITTLEQRHQMKLSGLTTMEVISKLNDVRPPQFTTIRSILQTCDWNRFSGSSSKKDKEKLLEDLWNVLLN